MCVAVPLRVGGERGVSCEGDWRVMMDFRGAATDSESFVGDEGARVDTERARDAEPRADVTAFAGLAERVDGEDPPDDGGPFIELARRSPLLLGTRWCDGRVAGAGLYFSRHLVRGFRSEKVLRTAGPASSSEPWIALIWLGRMKTP